MVNMNAADDKENSDKPIKNNVVNAEAIACSSTMCKPPENNERTTPQLKINGISSSQNSDCNNHPITNGAYPKTNSVSCSVTSACENGGPSESKKINTSEIPCGKSENVQKGVNCGESEKGLLGNSDACRSENNTCSAASTQRQPRPGDRGACSYDRNSSSEDEECCIYTYKGDSNQMADLPSSFFRLDLMPSRPNANSRNSSPDMDYLEMDFDPGPSNDRYSSSDSECDDERENEEMFPLEAPSLPNREENCESHAEAAVEPDIFPPTPVSPLSTPSPVLCPRPQSSPEQPHTSGSAFSPPPSLLQPTVQDDNSEGQQPSYCYCITNKLLPICIDENFNEGDTGTMVWKEPEAREKQVNQIATSACGATAVINALLGLNVPFTVDAVKQYVATRMRSETAPVVEYLLSRSVAGATHEDMIRGLQGASQDTVYARFFHMYPQRSISLTSWLSHWIRKGAVPIATLNLQRGVRAGAEIPDMWHHQMIHGVSSRGVHLTNPLEVQPEARLWLQLASPSVMLVRTEDVISRWTPDTNLLPLIHPSRSLWRKINVLGQVANVIRENHGSCQPTRHISIPASYSSGVTLAVLKNSAACDELRFAPELPIDPFATS